MSGTVACNFTQELLCIYKTTGKEMYPFYESKQIFYSFLVKHYFISGLYALENWLNITHWVTGLQKYHKE